MNDKHRQDAWLARPESIRLLWKLFAVVLAMTVVAQFFGVDGWPGFAAIFGFVSCLLMVLVAKALGLVLKRDQDYYKEESDV
jgi:hypothetical protein